jgi:hypothetical protein
MKMIQLILLLVLVSSMSLSVAGMSLYPEGENPYTTCADWGHYHCVCPVDYLEVEKECAAWGHYRCMCSHSTSTK